MFGIAVFVAAAFVARPLTSTRHAARLARRWEVRDGGLPAGWLFFQFERTADRQLTFRECRAINENQTLDLLASPAGGFDPLYVDGDFLYGRGPDDPTRFWFEGAVFVRDSLTPSPAPFPDAPSRWVPAPPAETRESSPQPLTPR